MSNVHPVPDPEELIQEIAQTTNADALDEALQELETTYGLTLTADGRVVKVAKPSREAMRDGMAAGREKGAAAATTTGRALRKVSRSLVYGVVDAPVEGAKTLKEIASDSHARRVSEARERRAEREARREQRRAERKAKREQRESEKEDSSTS